MWHTNHEIFQNSVTDSAFYSFQNIFLKSKSELQHSTFCENMTKHFASITDSLSSKWLNLFVLFCFVLFCFVFFKMPFSLIKICVYALLANHRKYFFFLLLHWIIPLMISGAARDQTLQKKNSHKQTFWLSSNLSKGKKNSEILESKLIGNSEQNPVLVNSSLLLTVFTVNLEFY